MLRILQFAAEIGFWKEDSRRTDSFLQVGGVDWEIIEERSMKLKAAEKVECVEPSGGKEQAATAKRNAAVAQKHALKAANIAMEAAIASLRIATCVSGREAEGVFKAQRGAIECLGQRMLGLNMKVTHEMDSDGAVMARGSTVACELDGDEVLSSVNKASRASATVESNFGDSGYMASVDDAFGRVPDMEKQDSVSAMFETVESRSTVSSPEGPPRVGTSPPVPMAIAANSGLYCATCNVYTTCHFNMQEHFIGRRHHKTAQDTG